MDKKRAIIILSVFTLCFMLLIIRVFYIQTFKGEKLSKAAAVQRIGETDFESPRGNILDRNGIPLTNRNKKTILLLKPLYFRGRDEELNILSSLLKTDYNELRREVQIKKEPILFELEENERDQIVNMGLEGVSIVNSLKRYDEGSVARHLTGYIKKIDQIGESGIEKKYEDTLKIAGENSVGVVTDARNNLIKGIGYKINAEETIKSNLHIMLTIDYHIQRIVEDVLDKNRITGAVVVEDIKNGNIVAIASKPDFDQNDVGGYLESPDNALFNRAVASYDVGSIFKIIDVAKYFEMNHSLNRSFYCPGYILVGDRKFRCSSYADGGHGYVTLKEAFAKSCNAFFIDAGIKMGHKGLLEMAQRFGLGIPTGLEYAGIPEAIGVLPSVPENLTTGFTANIAIGQGDIMATPLQVANIMATVANGGIKNEASVVDSIRDDEMNRIKDLNIKVGERIISQEISEKLKRLLEEVTINGTGKKAALKEYGGAAGKTGSAETGQYKNGQKVVHAWFAGYFPINEPKYSIAVFVEGGQSGGEVAAPIFEEIAKEIVLKGL